ncbi:LOW QUALITY PROTEIN: uncharacterized protein LOC128264569 [Drosophila gunungcola]|uniref:LOW QUALITY PROTEIN: uncharacterized protein LOC128264569 n=1 Tax=Drosophila gunungcola TaxID=103775 RepID=UPI0022E97344|nr:LOW QUALITY PROTEIN: uncharacterized protein LOC128264569 [Drosophila gunungcola]
MWHLCLASVLLGLAVVSWADTLVQLHVNRPYNDVNEKFVSFAVRPEDLYDALDGKNRKAVTSLANLLGDAHIKFVGDFYFASNAPTRLRNPTKIVWKGFNRWTRAVNWTMIIPVPYAPDEWDSMHTLKILNTSYMVGITDCIWQLGTDFGTSRAKDYVQELRTLKLMTDTFKPYVDDWRLMGADISAGSSADETKRYVDMSKDLNTAFGWTQPANMLPKSSLGSYLYDSDPALRILQQQRVPLWLTLPEERSSQRLVGDETTDALRWAQTMGDAATSGFDVIFKRMTLLDFERPNFSLYVTAMFKKVMGSRVFPARPLNVFAPSNKLYTHCASAVSGGLAFMVVNTEEEPTTITVKSTSRLSSSEIWQYVLTGLDQKVQLNNVRLHLNTTLRPLIKPIDPTKPLQLITPSMSVGFWVLPDVNLEHCQFTEIEAGDSSGESSKEKRRSSRYSSADRLLQRLIEETAVARGSVQSSINRNRRFVVDKEETPVTLLDRLLQHFKDDGPSKRDADDGKDKSVKPHKALAWLYQVLEQSRDLGKKRARRSTSSYSGPFFYNRQGKKSALTKKITEIRKPERKNKPLFDFDEFDEEKFFKRIGEKSEETPTYSRLPEGDVHLKNIESVDGDENEQEVEQEVPKRRRTKPKNQLKIIQRAEEDENEPEQEQEQTEQSVGRAKLRLLPTEFFEALPAPKPNKRLNLGATLNSLLFPEPFSSKATMAKGAPSKPKPVEEPEEDVEPVPSARRRHSRIGHVANDFLQAQKELGKHFLSHISEHEHEFSLGDEAVQESSLESGKKSLFGTKKAVPALQKTLPEKVDEGITSWWDVPAMRRRRAVLPSNSLEELRSNGIDKADREEMLPLGRYTFYEYKVDQSPEKEASQPKEEKESKIMKISKTSGKDRSLTAISESLVSTVKSKVSRFINIISNHMNEWYNTLTKHLDTDTEPQKPRRQNTIEK